MRETLVRTFGGQFLADLADKIEAGEYGLGVAAAYAKLKGRKRVLGYLIYLAGYAAAATATTLGCAGETVLEGCGYVIAASQAITWLGWGLLQLGILDHSARRKPEGVPRELQTVAGNQLFWGLLVFLTAIGAQAIAPEVADTFVNEILVLTLVQGGLLLPGTAAGVASPAPRRGAMLR